MDPLSNLQIQRKNIFAFTSSGKPVFAKLGNDEDLVTIFGFLQAVISIVISTGDIVKCVKAGERNIVFLLKQSLYFVIVSSTPEPENVLLKQLEFTYQQILLILTAKVHDTLEKNPAIDLRPLLGSDSERILRAGCEGDISSLSVAFHAIPALYCDRLLREDILLKLKTTVEQSEAAMGILLHEGYIISICQNPDTEFSLGTADAMLITTFASKFARTSDQHWVPLCFPSFNSQGYLQAYVGNMVTSDAESKSFFTLIFIAVSSNPEAFRQLALGKEYLEDAFNDPSLAPPLNMMIDHNIEALNNIRDECSCLHFLYKLYPVQKLRGNEMKMGICHYVQCEALDPINTPTQQEKIITEYEKLALRLRRGTSQMESTLFPPDNIPDSQGKTSIIGDFIRNRKMKSLRTVSQTNNIVVTEANTLTACFDDAVGLLASLPSTDNCVAFTTLECGLTMFAFASYDFELFVTFPAKFPYAEVTMIVDTLAKTLKSSSSNILCQC